MRSSFKIRVNNVVDGYMSFTVIDRNKKSAVFWDTLDVSSRDMVFQARRYLRKIVRGFYLDSPKDISR